jgi:hypothetical protein
MPLLHMRRPYRDPAIMRRGQLLDSLDLGHKVNCTQLSLSQIVR